jgi:hypothetical protein
MPYKSEAQKRYMHAEHPDIAAKWDAEMSTKKPHKSKVKSMARKAFGGLYSK